MDAAGAPILTDAVIRSSGPLANLNYRRPADAIEGTTAAGANAAWERGKGRHRFIEEQRAGYVAAIGGIVTFSGVIRGFATWGALTTDPRWTELAWRAGRYYYGTLVLARPPLLP